MHRWYQLTAEKAKMYEETGLLYPERGYHYETSNGIQMVEVHVDEIPDKLIPTIKQQTHYLPIYMRNALSVATSVSTLIPLKNHCWPLAMMSVFSASLFYFKILERN
jgi:hypothetical protein